MIVKYNKKRIEISARKLSFWEMGIGLMFKGKNTGNLLFDFSGKERYVVLTSYFVFFDFLVLWLDKENNVVEWKIVKPFTSSIVCKKPFSKILEIPFNSKNTKILEMVVGKQRFK